MPVLSGRLRNHPAFLVGAVAVLALVAVVLRQVLFRPAPPEPERPLAELVKVEGRFLLRSDTNRPFSGWVTERYGSGVLRSRSHVVEGRLEGISEGWHTNGVLQVREHFVAGLSEGLVTKWHPDGSKASEGVSHAGKFEGAFRRWHTNGQLSEEVFIQNGEPHGLSRAWYPDGSLKAEVRLEKGRVIQQNFWQPGERSASNLAVASPATP